MIVGLGNVFWGLGVFIRGGCGVEGMEREMVSNIVEEVFRIKDRKGMFPGIVYLSSKDSAFLERVRSGILEKGIFALPMNGHNFDDCYHVDLDYMRKV